MLGYRKQQIVVTYLSAKVLTVQQYDPTDSLPLGESPIAVK